MSSFASKFESPFVTSSFRVSASRARDIAAVMLGAWAAACSGNTTTAPPAAASLAVTSGVNQTGSVGTALASPIVVRVTDGSGNAVAGITVTFTAAAGSGSASTASATTDASGFAESAWTLGTLVGADSLVVAASGLSPVTVAATATAGAPAAVSVVAGNQQSASAGSALPAPLTVKVTDQYGNPVPNAAVTWSDDAGGAFASVTTMTDANGLAQEVYTLAPSAGTGDVVAQIMGSGGPVSATFNESAF